MPSLPKNESSPVSDGSALQSSVIKENLWDLAYELLKNDKEKRQLIETYEKILSEESKGSPLVAYDVASTRDREQQMSRIVQEKFQAVQDARWKFEVFSKEIEVRKQFDRAVGAVIWAKDLITPAVSSEPHTALAWAGVCLILPVSFIP
jgi:ankyrin repeat domain-containing protein 50